MKHREQLTPTGFDRLMAGPEKIWGLTNIASAIGRNVDTTRRLSRRPDVPIYQPPGGGYFALRTELANWMRTKA